jgi:hypothetical protein
MFLRKLLSRPEPAQTPATQTQATQTQATQAPTAPAAEFAPHTSSEARPSTAATPPNNVLAFPGASMTQPAEAESFALRDIPVPAPKKHLGLLDDERLNAFLEAHHYEFGRYNGVHYLSAAAQELGLESLIAQFQNILQGMVARRQSKLDGLMRAQVDVVGTSPDMAEKIKLHGHALERDIAELQGQIRLASEQRGWILGALNRYRQGFQNGVRVAIESDFLN